MLEECGRPDLILRTFSCREAGGIENRQPKDSYVLTEHSSPFFHALGTEMSRSPGARDFDWREPGDRIISPALAKQLLDFQPDLNIEIIGESVRTDFFLPADTPERRNGTGKKFFVAARLAEQKGLDHLIKAVHLLGERGLNSFEVVIGGGGPDREKLEELATRWVFRRCRFLEH